MLDALRNGWYGKSAYYYCETFESEFAEYHGRRYALMTPNCTSAIHLMLAGLASGIATRSSCRTVRGSPRLPRLVISALTGLRRYRFENWCLTPETIERAITPRTKAIIVVDLYGNMPDWDEILELGERRGIAVIEDWRKLWLGI